MSKQERDSLFRWMTVLFFGCSIFFSGILLGKLDTFSLTPQVITIVTIAFIGLTLLMLFFLWNVKSYASAPTVKQPAIRQNSSRPKIQKQRKQSQDTRHSASSVTQTAHEYNVVKPKAHIAIQYFLRKDPYGERYDEAIVTRSLSPHEFCLLQNLRGNRWFSRASGNLPEPDLQLISRQRLENLQSDSKVQTSIKYACFN